MKVFVVWFTTDDFNLDYEIVAAHDEDEVRASWLGAKIDDIDEVPADENYLSWI